MKFNRENTHILSSWWWTVDRVTLSAIVLLMLLGTMLVATTGPIIADRLGFEPNYFLKRHLLFLILACFLSIGISFLSPTLIKRLSVIGFIGGVVTLLIVLLAGEEINGAKRWLSIVGFSLQPSEFMKPIFIIMTAWFLSEAKTRAAFAGFKLSLLCYLLLVSLLISQPDLGMTIVVSAVWASQWFLAGIAMSWIMIFVVVCVFGLLMAYLFLPHVSARIDSFFSPDDRGNYQVQKALEAFHSGGMGGRGPGEGIVKQHLPDCHTDFIFAVAGEELGALVCILIVIIYALIMMRGFMRMLEEQDLFIVYAVCGLLIQFGIQAIINMGVAIHLLPTKGMTLPFISYGGSSMLAMGIAMGILLSLTKRRYGNVMVKRKILV